MSSNMEVRTFKASSLADALQLVRHAMGPDAAVVSTEEKNTGLLGRLMGNRAVEVTAVIHAHSGHDASTASPIPMPHPAQPTSDGAALYSDLPATTDVPSMDLFAEDYRSRFRRFAAEDSEASLLEAMIEQHETKRSTRLPSSLFRLFTDLIDNDVDDRFSRELVEELQRHSTPAELSDAELVREKAIERLSRQISVAPSIGDFPAERRVVALVGPTGVGKTTTVAKLAANLRLRDQRRVGLITVDTYRIAAVDQLRAYADIIDLPMEIVTTPREMRAATSALADLDIVLIDTAGRSPHDRIQIQELKAMLTEARANDVQLVLSSVSNARHLTRVVEQFRPVEPTSLLLTKLDEAATYGHLLPLLCNNRLPISYTTHGQNVPDDIQSAEPSRLVESVLRG